MITVRTNINQVVQVTVTRLQNLGDTDKMLRTCAISVNDLMRKRIHQDGLAADGNAIGTYSPAYMKVRTGDYGNSKRVARGKNKGTLKNAGVFSKGLSVLTARPQYNRTSDTKVVASLTRQMENDMKVIALNSGSYGIGYSNIENFKKSQYVESTYDKPIFSLTESEKQAVTDIVKTFLTDAVS